MTIVLNTNALSTFHRTSSLNVIESLFAGQDILVPETVLQEFVKKNFTTPAFLKRVTLTVTQKSLASSMIGSLHPAECEAIVLAKDTGWILVTDDRRAKKKAKALDVNVAGCLAVIKNAFTGCYIRESERDRIIDEGKTASYWPEDIVREVLSLKKSSP